MCVNIKRASFESILGWRWRADEVIKRRILFLGRREESVLLFIIRICVYFINLPTDAFFSTARGVVIKKCYVTLSVNKELFCCSFALPMRLRSGSKPNKLFFVSRHTHGRRFLVISDAATWVLSCAPFRFDTGDELKDCVAAGRARNAEHSYRDSRRYSPTGNKGENTYVISET